MVHDANLTQPASLLSEAALRLPSTERHHLRNALLALRNGLGILGELDLQATGTLGGLSSSEHAQVLAEMHEALRHLEQQLFGPVPVLSGG
jgi:hypothetical protein